MITEKDLLDAIDECQHVQNPNANTCIKLSAYYTILQNMYPDEPVTYSYASRSESDFAKAIAAKDYQEVLSIMDEAMDALSVLQPKLYLSIMRKIKGL